VGGDWAVGEGARNILGWLTGWLAGWLFVCLASQECAKL